MKTINQKIGFYLTAFLIFCPASIWAQKSKTPKETLEQEIRRLDLAEAEALQKKDLQTLDNLAAVDFTTNSPRNTIVKGNEGVKELVRTGVIDYASFVREVE